MRQNLNRDQSRSRNYIVRKNGNQQQRGPNRPRNQQVRGGNQQSRGGNPQSRGGNPQSRGGNQRGGNQTRGRPQKKNGSFH